MSKLADSYIRDYSPRRRRRSWFGSDDEIERQIKSTPCKNYKLVRQQIGEWAGIIMLRNELLWVVLSDDGEARGPRR